MSATWMINENRLRALAADRGWYNLNDIAHAVGVAPSTLYRAVNGKNSPGKDLTASIRLVFGEQAFAEICTAVEQAS